MQPPFVEKQGIRQPYAALELCAWIALADERGLIATIDDFATLPRGLPVLIVPLECSKFLLHEYPGRYPKLAPATVHTPTDFFKPLRETFVRSGDLTDVTLRYHSQGGIATRTKPQVTGRWTFADGKVCEAASIYSTRDNRQAEAGSGDGYTRFILWSRLEGADMPPMYNGPGYW
jgi:hypothetical protein